MWAVIDTPTAVHIVPEDDLKAHRLSAGCECNPACDEGAKHGDVVFWLVTHHSYDGREENEPR